MFSCFFFILARPPSHTYTQLFEIRPTAEELKQVLKDSHSSVRAVGVLYVRFTQPTEDILSWVDLPLREVETPIFVNPRGLEESTKTTMSKFVRNVLLETKYLDTRFPRVPERRLRDLRTGADEAIAEASGRGGGDRGGRSRGGSGDRGQSGRDRDYDRDQKGKAGEGEPKKRRRLGRLGLEDLSRMDDKAKAGDDAGSRRAERSERMGGYQSMRRGVGGRDEESPSRSRTATPEPEVDAGSKESKALNKLKNLA